MAALADKRISVTPLRLDLTDEPFMTKLADVRLNRAKAACALSGRRSAVPPQCGGREEQVTGRPAMKNESRMEFLLALRRRGISDAAVLRAIEGCRASISSSRASADAYADQALPIDCGQTISQPYVVAYMTEQLDVRRTTRAGDRHRLGLSGGGAVAAGARVVTIERYRTLAARPAPASRRSARQRQRHRRRRHEGRAGAGAVRPHHRHRRGRDIPDALIEQLADGGIMVLPLGPAARRAAHREADETADGIDREALIAVRFVPLVPGQANEL